MAAAVISLGSNMGDRVAALDSAVVRLEGLGRLLALSHLYETEPVGGVPQDPFYNAVAVVETPLGAEAMVGRLLSIETALGRVRGRRWGPRLIDLDLILHGDTSIRTAAVTVPHSHYRERRFVLEPLVEVWPGIRDPDGTLVADLLPGVADQPLRRIEGLGWRGDEARPLVDRPELS